MDARHISGGNDDNNFDYFRNGNPFSIAGLQGAIQTVAGEQIAMLLHIVFAHGAIFLASIF